MNEELSGWKVAAFLVGIAAAFAYVGAGDYEDAVEAEAERASPPTRQLLCETTAACEERIAAGLPLWKEAGR